MKSVLSLFCLTLLAATVFAAMPVSSGPAHMPAGNPLDTQWGPDPFGYRAKDSNEPDGPDFQWFDIEATGTPVSGLGDDNVSSQFSIGWDFHYYWYDVDHFWVGSNGYIEFLAGNLHAASFLQFPNANYHDVLGVWMSDWEFGTGLTSLCYYWSNNTDTLIVMFKDVEAWSAGGDHDFEIILSGVDSSITYMYGTSTGIPASNQSRGFDNITGALGLSFAFGSSNPANNSAIKIYYPQVITYAVHDLGIAGVQSFDSPNFFLLNNQPLIPWLAVRNSGNQNETSYTARYTVRNRTNNTLIATDDTSMGASAPAQIDEITFPELWAPGSTGAYKIVGRVTLTGDNYTPNDSVVTFARSLSLPGELLYDDNISDQPWSWQGGDGGMANEFVPPVYPVMITQVRIYVNTPGPFTAEILDDGGIGEPGSPLWSQSVPNPAGGGWETLNVDPPVLIESGPFYVAWITAEQTADFGFDTLATVGTFNRTWEFTGVWARFREARTKVAMIRCTIDVAGNHAPVITNFSPATLDSVVLGSSVNFSVTATDQDNDSLAYQWKLNGTVVGTSPAASITFSQLGTSHVRCYVTDGVDVDSVGWDPLVYEGTAADDPGSAVPSHFALHAAYPNPFNPATQISYDVAQETFVSLRVYNLAGEVVGTLVNARVRPGHYTVAWNASGQPSGTYFVSLDAGTFHQVMKTLLLK